MVPVSVLDLSPVTTGSSGPQALRNSLDLARHADRLGFTRYWVAEHHNMPNIASSAPDIMIGQIAAATSHLRVGSGGVMLPNHAPLQVAERYKVLEGLVSRPHRSRPWPRAGHRPGDAHTRCGAGRRIRPRTIFSTASRSCSPSSSGCSRSLIRSARSTPCRPTCRCRRSICWAQAATARSLPPMSAPDSRSRITSPISIRSAR